MRNLRLSRSEGVTVGEWCRDVLLARVHACQAIAVTAAERALLAEIVALRAILLNALYKLAPQEDLTDQTKRTASKLESMRESSESTPGRI